MLKSELLKSILRSPAAKFRAARTSLGILFCLTALLASASAQDFTLQATPFNPPAVNPGGNSSSTITVGSLNGFTGTVDLTCQVTPQLTPPLVTPDCVISPASVAPPGSATATVTTTTPEGVTPSGTSPPGPYQVTISGSASGETTQTLPPLNLAVLAVTPVFTVTVGTAVIPGSVHAGSGGQGIININPIDGYTGSVTLSCATITPLVTIPPVCSFNPNPVTVTGALATSTLTINTIAPLPTAANSGPRGFYALWLSLPLLGFVGLGAAVSRKRSRKAWVLFGLFVLGASLLLTPACGNNTTLVNNNTNATTPNNTYTFTVVGVDANGISSSNTTTNGTTTANPTVSLTVN